LKGFLAFSPHELFDLKLIRVFLRRRIATLGFAMATAGLALPEPNRPDVVREAGLRDPPQILRPAVRRLQHRGQSARRIVTKEILTVQNGSLSGHATLYAVVVLGLSLVATTLVLLALLFF
jgi:hypothetical protein